MLSSVLYFRMAARHGGSAKEDEVVLNFSNGNSRSKADDVDKFMSQML